MIVQEKIKVMRKQIPIRRIRFLFRESYIHSKIPTDYPQNPWGFITVPIPMGIPIPTAALVSSGRGSVSSTHRSLSSAGTVAVDKSATVTWRNIAQTQLTAK